MTTPPPDDHDDPTVSPDAPMDDQRLAALRALLRDEPIDVDPAATESRIMAALDAADARPVPTELDRATTGRPEVRRTTTPRTHRAGRPLLVAAAVLAVVGVGAVVWSSTERDAEFMASAGDASEAEATAPGDGGVAGGAQDDSAGAGADAAPTTTVAPAAPAIPSDAGLVDLGRFDSVQQLLRDVPEDLLRRTPTDPGASSNEQFDTDAASAPACAALRRSQGEQVLGIATVAGTSVLLTEIDGTRAVVEVPDCRPMG